MSVVILVFIILSANRLFHGTTGAHRRRLSYVLVTISYIRFVVNGTISARTHIHATRDEFVEGHNALGNTVRTEVARTLQRYYEPISPWAGCIRRDAAGLPEDHLPLEYYRAIVNVSRLSPDGFCIINNCRGWRCIRWFGHTREIERRLGRAEIIGQRTGERFRDTQAFSTARKPNTFGT